MDSKMSRRESRESDSKRHRSKFDREPSPKRSRRDGKPATERPTSNLNLDVSDHSDRDQKNRRRLQDALPLEAPPAPNSKVETVAGSKELEKNSNGQTVGTKNSSNPIEVTRARSFFQHDERGNAGQASRTTGRGATTERGWRDSKDQRNESTTEKTAMRVTEQRDEKSQDHGWRDSKDRRIERTTEKTATRVSEQRDEKSHTRVTDQKDKKSQERGWRDSKDQRSERATEKTATRVTEQRDEKSHERGWRDSKDQRSERATEKSATRVSEQRDEKSHAREGDDRVWRHDRFYEIEADRQPPARKRPSFREKKVAEDSENADKTGTEPVKPSSSDRPVLGSQRREEREGHNPRSSDRPEKPFLVDREANRGEAQRGSFPLRERYGGGGGGGTFRGRERFNGGRRGYHPSGVRVEKWKHDMFEEANRSPTPKNEEDQIAKVEALLAS